MFIKNGAAQSVTIVVFGSRKAGKSALISKFLFPKQKLGKYQKTVLAHNIKQRMWLSRIYGKITAHPVIYSIIECSEVTLFRQARAQTDCFLLVYNVNDQESWEFLKTVYEDCKILGKPVVLCGMGIDLVCPDSVIPLKQPVNAKNGSSNSHLPHRRVSASTVKTWAADERKLMVFEASADDPVAIEEVFRYLAEISRKQSQHSSPVKQPSLFGRMAMALSVKKSTSDAKSTNKSSERKYQINHPLLTNSIISTGKSPLSSKILHKRDIAWDNYLNQQKY
jgi:GTPase SAR1 family protein